MIPYKDLNGNKRNYFADFVIENKYLVEIKPKALFGSKNVILKKDAAIQWYNIRGLKYKTISSRKVSNENIKNLYLEGSLIFMKRYEEKFKEKYL